jgi:hypothetical protein
MKQSENIPKAMKEKYQEIIELTNNFSAEHLNDEYAQLIRFTVAALCRKRPSPLATGKVNTWACGIVHAIGMANYLFDKSRTPHITASDLYNIFAVGHSTGQGKSKQVRNILKISQFDHQWYLPSRIGQNSIIPNAIINFPHQSSL